MQVSSEIRRRSQMNRVKAAQRCGHQHARAIEYGHADTNLVDLSQHGGLPSRTQDVTLSVWEWRADGIYVLGATVDTQLRLRYLKAYPDFTDATSPVLVRNAQEAIAYATAALGAWSRGSPLAERWDDAATDAIEDLVTAAVRREQQSSRRRRPFSARSGYTPF